MKLKHFFTIVSARKILLPATIDIFYRFKKTQYRVSVDDAIGLKKRCDKMNLIRLRLKMWRANRAENPNTKNIY